MQRLADLIAADCDLEEHPNVMVESDSGDDDPVETDLQREDLPDQAGVNFDDLTLNAVRRRLGTIMTLWQAQLLQIFPSAFSAPSLPNRMYE